MNYTFWSHFHEFWNNHRFFHFLEFFSHAQIRIKVDQKSLKSIKKAPKYIDGELKTWRIRIEQVYPNIYSHLQNSAFLSSKFIFFTKSVKKIVFFSLHKRRFFCEEVLTHSEEWNTFPTWLVSLPNLTGTSLGLLHVNSAFSLLLWEF